MTDDYLWEKAPLVEVIAEVHWALKKLDSAPPDARIDPYYELFRDEFVEACRAEGFEHSQELMPSIVPLELTADQPRVRIRAKPDSWPLMQIGPGLMTANIVPPYKGWAAFEPFLAASIDRLFTSYPIASKTLQIERLHLRYVDGFDKSFGLDDYPAFAFSKLGIGPMLPEAFIAEHVQETSQSSFIVESRFQNKSPEGAAGNIKLSPGRINGQDAAVLELQCESRYPDKSATDIGFIKKWFNEAHQTLRSQFENIATDELKEIMGERVDIGAAE